MDEVRSGHFAASIEGVDGSVRWLEPRVGHSARINESKADMDTSFVVVNGLLANLCPGDIQDGILLSWRVVAGSVAKISNVGTGHAEVELRLRLRM